MSAEPSERLTLRRLLAGPPAAAAADGLRLRRWFAAFVGWLVLLTVVAVWSTGHLDGSQSAARSAWLVAVALFYLSLCCIFFPAPTVWIVMLLASNEVALLESAGERVVVVALLCALATGVANLNEYHVITFLLRYGRIGKVRDTRVYRWAAKWFAVSPFVVVALFGFLPLPVDVVRWLAILYRYSRWRYFAAYVLGRFPRYVVWALSAVWLDLTWWQILVCQAALVLAAGVMVAHSVWRRRRGARAATGGIADAERMT